MPSVLDNLNEIRSKIDAAAAKTGRKGADVRLIAVTKGVKAERIREAVDAGLGSLGENRVQEAEEKTAALGMPVEWHMIGHLQTNKAKTAAELFSVVQSVDSLKLAQKLSQEAQALNKTLRILLEVNVSGEEQKHGFGPDELYGVVGQIAALPALKTEGLMGMAPNTQDTAPRREAFKKLKGLFIVCKGLKYPTVEMKTLSMGMSDDYEIAVEEGANMVRIGRALFR